MKKNKNPVQGNFLEKSPKPNLRLDVGMISITDYGRIIIISLIFYSPNPYLNSQS